MSDKQILDEVYRRLCWTTDNWSHMNMDRMFDRVHDMKDMIQQEWQRADEEKTVSEYNRNRNPKDWIVDVREMERHRGLEIGEDGTVKELK